MLQRQGQPPDASSTAVFRSPDRVVSVREAAGRVGLCERTLRNLYVSGGGPARVRLTSRRVGYRISDLDAFVAANTFRHTADEATRRG